MYKQIIITTALLIAAVVMVSAGYENNREPSNEEIMSIINAGGSESLYTKEIN